MCLFLIIMKRKMANYILIVYIINGVAARRATKMVLVTVSSTLVYLTYIKKIRFTYLCYFQHKYVSYYCINKILFYNLNCK